MNKIMIKQMLDACFEAKKITEMMPELPSKMKPRHIHVIDAVYSMYKSSEKATVGDVSKKLNVTMPSVTKLVNELCDLGMLTKCGSREDKRITYLQLTNDGEKCYDFYVEKYHQWLSDLMESVNEEQVKNAIQTMHSLYTVMQENKMPESITQENKMPESITQKNKMPENKM